jgi:hemoglobin
LLFVRLPICALYVILTCDVPERGVRADDFGTVPDHSCDPRRVGVQRKQLRCSKQRNRAGLRARDSHTRIGAMTETIYEAAGGRQAFINLARAWHARCLADPVVSHAFSHGYHPQHTERLAAYWAEALGGPTDYTESMGDEARVVRMHSGNGEHVEMDERAQICFAQALDDAGIPGDPRLRTTLKAYFRWATETMAAHPRGAEDVPAGLRLARWSWGGPA